MNPYLPLTPEQRKTILSALGRNSIEELLSEIYGPDRRPGLPDLPSALSESETAGKLTRLSGQNRHAGETLSLLGGGAYDHYIPAAVNHLALRSEWYTAYTPYQPEISQGTLQAIFEFQTFICEITGMEAANASLYDGATALLEGVNMARSLSKNRSDRLLMSRTVNPRYRSVVQTGLAARSIEVRELGYTPQGCSDLSGDLECFALVVQQPNYFGVWEDLPAMARTAAEKGLRVICVTDLLACALSEPPGNSGADIVVGDAQGFGNPMGFGGPHLGFMAARRENIRSMPGRIVGETRDLEGKKGYVLTAQTREQHIRREKATSNICSNQALNALCTAVHLSLLGADGFVQLAKLNSRNAHEIADFLQERGMQVHFPAPFFREWVAKPDARILDELEGSGKAFLGIDLSRDYPELSGFRLIAATEQTPLSRLREIMVQG